jgi:hypothetical protein
VLRAGASVGITAEDRASTTIGTSPSRAALARPRHRPWRGHARVIRAYTIVDSGHGFKTLAIGRLAAKEIATGSADPRLEPFRASRFERGELLAASKGPYPWT